MKKVKIKAKDLPGLPETCRKKTCLMSGGRRSLNLKGILRWNEDRIKSMSREIQMNTPQGGVYLSKERIRRAKLDTKLNKTVNDNLYTLVIALNRDGIKYHYSVARLVYCVFVEAFDLRDRTIYISLKDRNGRNIHVSNLCKTIPSNCILTSSGAP